MRLTRLQLRQFRRFHDGVVLNDLTPGLNLIHGPNEAGKSTLVRALRAAFFERYGTSTVSDLGPWGDAGAAPEVEIDFIWQDQTWRLAKRFLRKQRCNLAVGTEELTGDVAENRLASVFGFEYAGKGASNARHWGVPGLLWIEQGTTQTLREPAEHASKRLQSALGQDLSELASSAGDTILTRVDQLRAELLTAGGKPRAEYAHALTQLQSCETALQALEGQVRQYQGDVDQLAELSRLQAEQRRTQPWQGLREQQGRAAAALAEVRGWQAQEASERQEEQVKTSQLNLVRQEIVELQRRGRERQHRQTMLSHTASEAERLMTVRTEHEAARTAAAQAHRQAREELAQVRHRAEQERDLALLQQYERQVRDLRHRLEQARQLQAGDQSAEAELRAILMSDTDLQALKRLARQREDLALQRRLSATRLRYVLPEGLSLTLDGRAVERSGEVELLRAARVQLFDGTTLEILPGGTDLAEQERQAEALDAAWHEVCHRLQVGSLAQAEAVAERKRHLETVRRQHQALLKPLAPRGVQALADELLEADTQISQLASRQQHRTDGPAPPLPNLMEAETAEAVAERRLREAERVCHTAETALATAQAAQQQAKQEWAALEAHPLPSPDAEDALKARAGQLTQELQTLASRLQEQQARIDAAHPVTLKQDVERLGRSAEQLELQFRQRELQIVEQQSRLQALSAQGLEEQRAEMLRDCEQWRQRCEEFRRRAEALALLQQTLQKHRQALTQRLQAPLQRHLQRYLSLWAPGSQVVLDERLIPVRFSRATATGTEQGDLEGLSFGAREQIGLISRLAYADLLREAGHPTLIVLDDALTHSDQRRLEAMKRILFDAGQRHQILLLTCHPQAWQDLGVPARDLTTLPRPQPSAA